MKAFATNLFVFSIIVFVSVSANAQSKLTEDKFAVIDGKKVRYQTGGVGSTTVVFESGYGDGLDSWGPIYAQVVTFARVMRYDRDGLGKSECLDPNLQSKSFKQIATRLHVLLAKANLPPPYVLAGHSFGGSLIRAFAYLYPKEVAGLVFVDPQNEYNGSDLTQDERIQNPGIASMDSILKSNPALAARNAEWEIAKSEYINGYPELISFGALPNVPTVMFVAGTGGLKTGLRKLYLDKMSQLSIAYFIEVAQSDHYVHKNEPQLVIENIKRIVLTAEKK